MSIWGSLGSKISNSFVGSFVGNVYHEAGKLARGAEKRISPDIIHGMPMIEQVMYKLDSMKDIDELSVHQRDGVRSMYALLDSLTGSRGWFQEKLTLSKDSYYDMIDWIVPPSFMSLDPESIEFIRRVIISGDKSEVSKLPAYEKIRLAVFLSLRYQEVLYLCFNIDEKVSRITARIDIDEMNRQISLCKRKAARLSKAGEMSEHQVVMIAILYPQMVFNNNYDLRDYSEVNAQYIRNDNPVLAMTTGFDRYLSKVFDEVLAVGNGKMNEHFNRYVLSSLRQTDPRVWFGKDELWKYYYTVLKEILEIKERLADDERNDKIGEVYASAVDVIKGFWSPKQGSGSGTGNGNSVGTGSSSNSSSTNRNSGINKNINQNRGFNQQGGFGAQSGFGSVNGFNQQGGFGAQSGFGSVNGFNQRGQQGSFNQRGQQGYYNQTNGFNQQGSFNQRGQQGSYRDFVARGQAFSNSFSNAFGGNSGPRMLSRPTEFDNFFNQCRQRIRTNSKLKFMFSIQGIDEEFAMYTFPLFQDSREFGDSAVIDIVMPNTQEVLRAIQGIKNPEAKTAAMEQFKIELDKGDYLSTVVSRGLRPDTIIEFYISRDGEKSKTQCACTTAEALCGYTKNQNLVTFSAFSEGLQNSSAVAVANYEQEIKEAAVKSERKRQESRKVTGDFKATSFFDSDIKDRMSKGDEGESDDFFIKETRDTRGSSYQRDRDDMNKEFSEFKSENVPDLKDRAKISAQQGIGNLWDQVKTGASKIGSKDSDARDMWFTAMKVDRERREMAEESKVQSVNFAASKRYADPVSEADVKDRYNQVAESEESNEKGLSSHLDEQLDSVDWDSMKSNRINKDTEKSDRVNADTEKSVVENTTDLDKKSPEVKKYNYNWD